MRSLVLFVSLFIIINCGYTIHRHGIPERVDAVKLWKQVKVGESREKVIDSLGLPTLVSQFDKNIWYYISYTIKQRNFLGKRRYNSLSLQITFDSDGKVLDTKEINISTRSLVCIAK